MDYFALIFDGINKILTQHASFYESLGMSLFRSFALILVSWFGIQAALSSAEGGPGFNWRGFSTLVQQLVLTYVMLAYYSNPIPGFDVSFTHLILDQAKAMVGELDQSSVQRVIESLNNAESFLPYPTPYEIAGIFRFIIVLICILAAQAVTLFIVMLGYVFTGVIVLLGPVFIPFLIVPKMDWMFWGWLRAFIQYSFYQVFAAAYVSIFGDYLLQFFGDKNAPLSGSDMLAIFVPLVVVLVVFTLGVVKVPALVFSVFSGRSGEYIFPGWR